MTRRSLFGMIAAAFTGRKQILAAAYKVAGHTFYELPRFDFGENMARSIGHAERVFPGFSGLYGCMIIQEITREEAKRRWPSTPLSENEDIQIRRYV